MTFNFVSKLKSPKPVTFDAKKKKSALTEQNLNVVEKKSSGITKKKSATKKVTVKDPSELTGSAGPKKSGPNLNRTNPRLNVTFGDTIK